jgi:hypothetical protein
MPIRVHGRRSPGVCAIRSAVALHETKIVSYRLASSGCTHRDEACKHRNPKPIYWPSRVHSYVGSAEIRSQPQGRKSGATERRESEQSVPPTGFGARFAGNVHREPTDGETRCAEDHEEGDNERTTTDRELGDSDCCSNDRDAHRQCLNSITDPVGRDPVLAH